MWELETSRHGDTFRNDSGEVLTVTEVRIEPATAADHVRWLVVRPDGTPSEINPTLPFQVASGLRLKFNVSRDESLAGEETVTSVVFTSADSTGRAQTQYAY